MDNSINSNLILARSEYMIGLTEGTITDEQRCAVRKYVESGEISQARLACAMLLTLGEKVACGMISAPEAVTSIAGELDALGITYFDLEVEKDNLAVLLSLYSEENRRLALEQKYGVLAALEGSDETSKFRAAYILFMLQSYLDGGAALTIEKVKGLNSCLRGIHVTDDISHAVVNVIKSALQGAV